MRVCGTQFCLGRTVFHPYGAAFYQSTAQSGVDNPAGAVALALREHLNTIRVVNFYDPARGDPATTPVSDATWDPVDVLIAHAQSAGIKVLLDLADYRNLLMDHCINPYTFDWTHFETYVAHRVNHVTGRLYANDPEIAMLSFSGEPLPVGHHGCISYTAQTLVDYYGRVSRTWRSLDPNHVIVPGGLGYLNFASGIDWRAIMAGPYVDACAFKTYGAMEQWVRVGATYCNGTLHKPWIDDEWGYPQSVGDRLRSTEFAAQFAVSDADHTAATFFWNAGHQAASTSYDVGPQTPITMACVQSHAP
jgi:hypothetical protein